MRKDKSRTNPVFKYISKKEKGKAPLPYKSTMYLRAGVMKDVPYLSPCYPKAEDKVYNLQDPTEITLTKCLI